MTSPSCCIDTGYTLFENNFFYVVSEKNPTTIPKNITIEHPRAYHNNAERFDNLASDMVAFLRFHQVDVVFLEGYAMGARGQVFNIGENTGVLKHHLHINRIPFVIVPPTTLKKFATGNGRATKEMMCKALYDVDESANNLDMIMFGKRKYDSPISDIVDSYWLAKFGVDKMK